MPVSVYCTASSASWKIPRMKRKRHGASLLTVLTDWKWHHCSSTSLHFQQSPSHRTVNTDAANEIKQGEVWLRCDGDTNSRRCFWPTWVKHAIFISRSHESSLHLMTRLPWRRDGTNLQMLDCNVSICLYTSFYRHVITGFTDAQISLHLKIQFTVPENWELYSQILTILWPILQLHTICSFYSLNYSKKQN